RGQRRRVRQVNQLVTICTGTAERLRAPAGGRREPIRSSAAPTASAFPISTPSLMRARVSPRHSTRSAWRPSPMLASRRSRATWKYLTTLLPGYLPSVSRYHVCWGSWPGPHTSDVPLGGIVDLILSAQVGAYLIEAANPRHEHEWKVWQETKLPEGKVLVPG